MSVSDGEKINAAVTNAAFMSRNIDTNTTGKVDLDNSDSESGDSIENVQRELNGQASFVGDTTGGTEDRLPTWSSDVIGSANDKVKDRVDAVQAQVEQNNSDIDLKTDRVNPSTDTAVPRFSSVSGDLQDSGVLIDGSDNVTIPGDLTVGGTTTTINTATLDVTDANITVNDGGTQATADSQDAGLTVEMSDATNAAIGYDSTLTSKFKVGEVGSEAEIVTVSDAQVISGKDIDGGTASDTSRITLPKETTTNLTALTRKEGTVFYDINDKNFFGDDGAAIIPLGGGGSGSGSGFKNYYDQYGLFESDPDVTNNASLFNDPSSYADGDGGTVAGLSVSRATGASELLEGVGSLQIDKAAVDSSGDGVTFLTRAIDRSDLGRQLFGSFELDSTDANYTSGDFSIKAYDVTNSEELAVISDDSDLPKDKRKILFSVLTNETTASIRVSLYLQSDSATGLAFSVFLDDLKLGPSPHITTVGERSEDIDLTGSGDFTGGSIRVSKTGRTVAISLLTSITFSSNDVPASATGLVPEWARPSADMRNTINSGSENWSFESKSDGTLRFIFVDQSGVSANRTSVNAASISYNVSDSISQNISTTENLFKNAAAKIFLSANQTGFSTLAKLIEFDSVNRDEVGLFSASDNGFKILKTGWYNLILNIRTNSLSGNERISLTILKNGSSLANSLSGSPVSDTDGNVVTLDFLEAGDVITSVASANSDTDWSVFGGGSDDSYFTIHAVPDLSVFSVFGQTEFLEANNAGALDNWPITVNQFGDLTSLDLTPGEWELNSTILLNNNGAITTSEVGLAISSTAGNSGAGQTRAVNRIDVQPPNQASGDFTPLNIGPYRVIVTEPTTYYLKARALTSITNLRVAYNITARRIK